MEKLITYLDESTIDNKYYTIASLTAKWEDYLQIIEPKWIKLRERYNIPNGAHIHFTNVKYLLSSNLNNPDPDTLSIFSDSSGHLDMSKLFSFFNDVTNFIQGSPFIVQVTGFSKDSAHNMRNVANNNNQAQKKSYKLMTYQPPFITFKEHLDLMAIYLLGLNHSPFRSSNMRITKLRYDGDTGLGERNDIKEAYHQSITLGTRHFRSELVKKIFDEIRFIGKNEVGDGNQICHAGNEIIDFIASTAARDLWGEELEKLVLKFNFPNYFSMQINTLDCVKPKILNSQKIRDVNF